jgi:hypothetical protein
MIFAEPRLIAAIAGRPTTGVTAGVPVDQRIDTILACAEILSDSDSIVTGLPGCLGITIEGDNYGRI